MYSDNFLPRGPISMIVFFFIGKEEEYLRGGLILICSSSDDMINDKITELFNSNEHIKQRYSGKSLIGIYTL